MSRFKEWVEWNLEINPNLNVKTISILLAAGILSFIIAYQMFNGEDNYREDKLSKLKGTTQAKIYKVQPKETLTQHYNGNKITVMGYDVYFNYKVGTIEYNTIDYIPNTSKNQKLIIEIYKNYDKKMFSVKYSISNPRKAMLIL